MRILGLDPGLKHTGWAVIEDDGARVRHVASGVISPAKTTLAMRLGDLSRGLAQVTREHAPEHAACERVFVNVNAQSTLLLGQARGAVIAACNLSGLEVDEFTPSEIKEAVTGSGRADKAMIQKMVVLRLGLPFEPRPDEADAIACALCFAQRRKLLALERSGATTRTYATARRGRSTAAARDAWTRLLEKGKK